MNLLEKVSQNGSTLAKYVYLSDGTKVSATNASGDGLVYLGSFIYKKAGSSVSLESASFGDGKFVASATGLEPHYLMRDHLGSVRRVVGEIVLEHNDYYPFGMRWNGGQLSDNRYRYNGKEEQSFLNLPYSDYGARMYDSRTGRFKGADQLSEKYFSSSPYAYCLNNPINAIDPDGRLVIFINGMHWGNGGTDKYWEGFDTKVKAHLKDDNAMYFDGSVGGASVLLLSKMSKTQIPNSTDPNFRHKAGYITGVAYAKEIAASLRKDETIKIITHSMGAAFAKGFIQALIDEGVDPSNFAFEADFAPFQPTKQSAIPGIPTFQFSHSKDVYAWPFEIFGAEYIDTSEDEKQSHHIIDFWNSASQLPTGNYKIVNGRIIPND